jgi:regulatory protein
VRRPRTETRAKAAEADERAVRTAALALLAGRDFGRQELAGRLLKKGYPPEHVEAAVAALVAAKLLSEERFLEQFVAMHARKGHGPVRIRAELRERGIDSGAADEAIDAAEVDWREIARDTRRRRFGTAAPADFRERAKQGRFLQNRGFTHEQIRAALGPGDEIDP